MPTVSDEVQAALERNPDADARWIQAAVSARKPEVAELSLRSFNARYVVPLQRKNRNGADLADHRTTPTALERHDQRVREIVAEELLDLVRKVVQADCSEIIDVVVGIETRVDRLLEALNHGVAP